MKKLALLLCLLLALLSLPALADDPVQQVEDAVYTIVLRQDGADTPLGSGVLLMEDDLLITAAACLTQEGTLYAIGQGGEYRLHTLATLGDTGLATAHLSAPAAAAPLRPSDMETYAMGSLFGVDAQGQHATVRLYDVLYGAYNGWGTLVVLAEDGLLPGALLPDDNGGAMAIILGRQAEGEGRYIALDADTIASITGLSAGASQQLPAAGSDALPITVQCDAGAAHITWQDERTTGMYIISLVGDGNSYYTTYTGDAGDRTAALPLVPGRTYHVVVQWAADENSFPEPAWDDTTAFTMPLADATPVAYTQECYIAIEPAGSQKSVCAPESLITADQLVDSALTPGLQIIGRYDVSADEEYPMIVELVAPDGQFFFEESGFIFSPEYESYDAFCYPMDALFADCAAFSAGGVAPGEYTARYYIGGALAGDTAFTVHPAGTPRPEETSLVGFITDLAVSCENGAIILDWSHSADLPREEGVTVSVYRALEGNLYHSGLTITEADETSAQLLTVPDRRADVWAVWAREGGDPNALYPEAAHEYFTLMPVEVAPYTLHGFTHVRCGITDRESDGTWQPTIEVTRELLQSGTPLYFQTEDRYDPVNDEGDHPLVVALYTPEGHTFLYQSGYVFMADYAQSDIWTMDLAEMLASYMQFHVGEDWPAGEYRFGYYVDGCEAGSFTFTLMEE